MTKTLKQIILQDRAELNQGLNRLAGNGTAEEQLEKAILQWIADEVIGEDESQIRSDGNKNTQEWTNGRNNQRQQQRNKLKSLGWKG